MKKTLLAVGIALGLVYFSPMVLNHSLLIYWGDELEQLIPHMHQFILWIQSGDFSFWNPSIGLGSSSLVGFFIALGSPFTLIAAFFPDTWLPYLMIWFDLIRYMVIAYFSYRWLSHHVQKESARMVGTFILTFSGYLMCWIHYAPFIDPFMGFMMVLALSEEVIKGKKVIPFSLAVLFTILVNPYYFYMFSWYLVFYLTYRLISLNFTGLAFVKKAWSIGRWYLLGVGLSSVILIPVALILKSAPRISSIQAVDFLPVLDPKSWFAIISAFFSPVVNDYSINLFYNYQAPALKLAIPHVYPLVIGSFLILPFITLKFPGKKNLLIFMASIMSMLFIPVFYKVFNGIMDVRWVFMIIFTFVLGVIQSVEHSEQISKRTWILNAIALLIILGLLTYVSYTKQFYWASASSTLKVHLLVYASLVFLYTFMFIKIPVRYHNVILGLLLIVEATLVLTLRMYTQGSPNYITQDIGYDFKDVFETEAIETIQANDSGLYRIDVQDGISTQAVAQDFPGFLMYMSTYNFESQPYYSNRFTPMRKWDYTDSKDLVKTLLGSKYYVYTQGDLPYGYTPQGNHIALNSVDMGLGFATPNSYNLSQLETLDTFSQDVAMYSGVFTNEGSSELKGVKPILLGSQLVNAGLEYTYQEPGQFIVDFSQSNPYGTCTVDYSKDGEVIKSITKEEYGYASFPILDANKIYFYCSFTYNPNEYIPVTVYELTHSSVDQIYAQLENHDFFENIQQSKDSVTASITVHSPKAVAYTTLAYDKGWSLKVDGVTTPIQKVNNGFVGFDLTQGDHTLELHYRPQGLWAGLLISVVSFGILLSIAVKQYLNRKGSV